MKTLAEKLAAISQKASVKLDAAKAEVREAEQAATQALRNLMKGKAEIIFQRRLLPEIKYAAQLGQREWNDDKDKCECKDDPALRQALCEIARREGFQFYATCLVPVGKSVGFYLVTVTW